MAEFYSSSYSRTTAQDVRATRQQAARDIKDFRRMNQMQAREALLKRFGVKVSADGRCQLIVRDRTRQR